MSVTREQLTEAINRYLEAFDEGPPIYGMDEAEAMELIENAIESGEKIIQEIETDIPKGAYT